MSNSEIKAKERYVHFLCLFPHGEKRIVTVKISNEQRITEALDQFARLHPAIIADPQLESGVVIDGYDSAQLYSAATFRWLCGVGPDPQGKDPSWMG